MGKIPWEDVSPAVQSWARLPIYQAAKQILDMPEKGERRNALGKIPAAIRPMVEAEIMRVFEYRKKAAK